MTPLERVSERVLRNGSPDNPDVPRPLLSLEEFFEGNTAVGSIGCNLPNATPTQFYEALAAIAARPDVKDIRVRITDFDVPSWPFSDTVFIMTTAQPQDVAAWFPKEIAPDEAWEGFHQGETYEPYTPPIDCRVVACWWD